MLFLIIRKEVLNNILSFRFVVTYALLFCLILLAMFLMTNEYGRRLEEGQAEEAKAREQIERIEAVDDPSEQLQELQRATLYGVRLPRSMSILAKGVDDGLPLQVSSRTGFFFGATDDRLSRNMLFEIFQTPDFVYVINVVMSLLALLFVFDAICGEKERGVLKLLMANSVPRDLVLLGKWVGGFVSVVGPFAVAVLGGFTYIYATGGFDQDAEGVERFWLIFGLSLLYVAACFTLGLMISAATHRTATSLLVCLMVWIGWILVVPNIAPVAARLMRPVPAKQVIDAEKQAIDRETQALLEGIRKRKVYGDRQETQRIQQEAEKRKAKLDRFAADKLAEQIELTKNLARLSPSAAFLFAATRLAGTGPDLYGHFSKAQGRFAEANQRYMRDIWNSGQVEWTRQGPKIKDADWFNPDELPRFKMFRESLGDSFDAALFDILLLTVFCVAFFMLSYVFFLRYDVT